MGVDRKKRTKLSLPVSGLALVAHAAVRVGPAAALAGGAVAEVVERADRVALARRAALRSEAERARRALVASAPNDVRLALALTACNQKEGALLFFYRFNTRERSNSNDSNKPSCGTLRA